MGRLNDSNCDRIVHCRQGCHSGFFLYPESCSKRLRPVLHAKVLMYIHWVCMPGSIQLLRYAKAEARAEAYLLILSWLISWKKALHRITRGDTLAVPSEGRKTRGKEDFEHPCLG